MRLYRNALKYAKKLDPVNYMDLVHNAFVYYYGMSGGGNLFLDRPEPYVMRCVKFMHKWHYNVEVKNKHFVEVTEGDAMADDLVAEIESEDSIETMTENVARYSSGGTVSVSPEKLQKTLYYLNIGYSGNEVAEIMGVSAAVISYWRSKLQEILGAWAPANRRRRLTKADHEPILAMLDQGMTMAEVSRRYGVSAPTIQRIRLKYKQV